MKLIYSEEQQNTSEKYGKITQSYGIIQLLDDEQRYIAVSYRLISGTISGDNTYFQYCDTMQEAMQLLMNWGLK